MSKKYQIILADPPWEYTLTGSTKNARGLAKQNYPEMKLADIKSLPVKDIKTDNAMLFLWATFPMISEALEVITSWGFTYKTAAFIWLKTNPITGKHFWGMGKYTRANAEVVLLGISNGTKALTDIKSRSIHQIVECPCQKHSQKPEEVRRRIELLCGDVPRIELFARVKRSGWDSWGNEIVSDIELGKQGDKG